MIINTDKLKYRMLSSGEYIAVYGTQDNPYSSDYDLLTKDEAINTASTLDSISEKIKDEAENLRSLIGKLAESPNDQAHPRRQ